MTTASIEKKEMIFAFSFMIIFIVISDALNAHGLRMKNDGK
jgi:hypothetical protein